MQHAKTLLLPGISRDCAIGEVWKIGTERAVRPPATGRTPYWFRNQEPTIGCIAGGRAREMRRARRLSPETPAAAAPDERENGQQDNGADGGVDDGSDDAGPQE